MSKDDPLARARAALADLEADPGVDDRGDPVFDVPLALRKHAARYLAGIHLRAALEEYDRLSARFNRLAAQADRQFNAACEAIDATGAPGITLPERIVNLAAERDRLAADLAKARALERCHE
jgi:hypothetical protein